jgi:hypothetical protein
MFAWKPADMPGVPWELIEHSLDVLKTAKSIKQKLRQFAWDKKEAIRVEVNQLLATSFIKRGVSPGVACQPGSYNKKE